MNEDDLVIN